MPHADPAARRKANRDAQQRLRDRKAAEKTGAPPPPPAAGEKAKPPFVSAKDLDLTHLAQQIRAETDNLSQDGWLNLQGALGLEIIAIVRASLRADLHVRSVKDVVLLLKLGTALINPVIEARGKLGGDDAIPSDLQQVHSDMLSDPLGVELAQQQMQLLSQIMLGRGN